MPNGAGTERGMLVRNSALEKHCGQARENPVVLMRGHGETVVGRSVKRPFSHLYTNIDARAQAAAMALTLSLSSWTMPTGSLRQGRKP